ncbi:hypothetical protein M885DRAFT_610788 [Pelagophyceae sp. CCMP2097]|nr:hypothetical protein M885DRAFT_610788 [Pelagophyceae sp. CCMP2097]|mmetsp:Transcript_15406/g.54858  ORF Transcript_15406/g.54858 Transcript_15406/m.54858 type:complete len:333 (+) Transcript_15406:129-1127(+)
MLCRAALCLGVATALVAPPPPKRAAAIRAANAKETIADDENAALYAALFARARDVDEAAPVEDATQAAVERGILEAAQGVYERGLLDEARKEQNQIFAEFALALADEEPEVAEPLYYDASATKKLYYSNFFNAAVKARGVSVVGTEPTKRVVDRLQAEWRGLRDSTGQSSQAWRWMLDPRQSLTYFDLDAARKSWLRVAERQHARAALVGSAALLAAPLDAERIGALAQFARCGCPEAIDTFLSGVPNAYVELPLLLVLIAFTAGELERCLFVADPAFATTVTRKNTKTDDEENPMLTKARAIWSGAEMLQGRFAMVASACLILAPALAPVA